MGVVVTAPCDIARSLDCAQMAGATYVRDLQRLAAGDALELVPGSRRDAETLEGMVEFLAGELHHPGLARLAGAFLDDATFRERLRKAPASESHHAYAGG